MEPIVALLALLARFSMRQDAIIAALERKGLLSKDDIEQQMPRTEKEIGWIFDTLKSEFFEFWSKFDDRGTN